jgi:dolichyl-phosphate-mannose-protein mannosyltransferase
VLALTGALALAAALLYTLTAARDIVLGDSAELMTVAVTLGVAHPPGYPLLTLLAHALTWLPVGPVPLRVNLLSVIAGAGTGAFVFLIGRRLTGDRLAAALAALLLAVQPLVWEWSIVLEVFSLNACLAAAELYWLLRWDEEPERPRWFVLAVATGALGAANHPSTVFVIPAALVVLWRRRAQVLSRPRAMAAAAAAALAGFSTYLYLPWAAARKPLISWGDISSAGDVLHHFLRTSYGTLSLSSAAGPVVSGGPWDRLAVLIGSFTAVEAVLVIAGAFVALRTKRLFFWLCALTFTLAGPVFVMAASLNPRLTGTAWVLKRFFVLPQVVVAPLAALSIAALTRRVGRLWPAGTVLSARMAVGVALAAVIGWSAVALYPVRDQRDNHLARQFAGDLLDTLEPHTVLLTGDEDLTLPLLYLQGVEHQRPDVTVVMLGPLTRGDWYIRELRAHDPALVVPFDHYDPTSGSANLRALVDANPARPFALIGPPLDSSLEPTYWLLPRGLTLEIEPQSHDVSLTDMDQENRRLFDAYHIPPAAVASHDNFDPLVLQAYADGARRVGLQYQANGLEAKANDWFGRADRIEHAK